MNLRELLADLGVQFREHGQSPHVTEGWVGVICPFCGTGTGKYGLGIHLRSLKVSCWKCGPHRLGESLAAITDKPLREVIGLLPEVESTPERAYLPTGKYAEPDGVGPLLPAHRRYLERRGFDPDQLSEEWGIRGIGHDSPYKWRLFIPVIRHEENESWTTRAVGRIEPRYLAAPPEMERRPLKSLLLGLDRVRHAVVVVEGPFGVLRIGSGTVCTFGLSFTNAQVLALSRIPVRVICFDNETGAQRRARELSDLLSPYPGSTYIATLSGPDPDTSPEDEIQELRKRFLE